MLDGFFTDDVTRIEIVRFGVDRPRSVTSMTVRAHELDGGYFDVPIDLRDHGINVETLLRTVREVNASLAARRRGGGT